MATEKPTKIKRSLWKNFLNTTPKGDTQTWSYMNLGITSQQMSYNPQTTSETYVGEDNARTSTDSYQMSMNTPMTCFKGDPIFEYIDGLRKSRAVEGDCETQMLSVNAYDGNTDSASTKFSAEMCDVSIAISDFGGDGGKPVSLTFTISVNGDPTKGTATISSDGAVTFTKG